MGIIALYIVYLLCIPALFLLIVRLFCALFSPQISASIRKHPVVHGIWACLALLGALQITGIVMNAGYWPSASAERRTQRQKVLERIQSVGGWPALQKDCDTLATQYLDTAFVWYRGNTNRLLPTLAALKPWYVEFYSPTVLRDFKDEPQVAVIRIKIFGMHSTGGHSTPYYGLEIVSGAGAETYRPRPKPAASGNSYSTNNPVTDRIYEIY